MHSTVRFDDRRERAKKSATFGTVVQTDSFGRARVVRVAGSDKFYTVYIKRFRDVDGKPFMETECKVSETAIGQVPCKGNWNAVCYHSLAAVYTAAATSGKEVAIFNQEPEPKVAQMYDQVVVVVNKARNDKVFVCLREKK